MWASKPVGSIEQSVSQRSRSSTGEFGCPLRVHHPPLIVWHLRTCRITLHLKLVDLDL